MKVGWLLSLHLSLSWSIVFALSHERDTIAHFHCSNRFYHSNKQHKLAWFKSGKVNSDFIGTNLLNMSRRFFPDLESCNKKSVNRRTTIDQEQREKVIMCGKQKEIKKLTTSRKITFLPRQTGIFGNYELQWIN